VSKHTDCLTICRNLGHNRGASIANKQGLVNAPHFPFKGVYLVFLLASDNPRYITAGGSFYMDFHVTDLLINPAAGSYN
jgi:hypothetical protein